MAKRRTIYFDRHRDDIPRIRFQIYELEQLAFELSEVPDGATLRLEKHVVNGVERLHIVYDLPRKD